MSAWPITDTASTVFPLSSRARAGKAFPDPITPLNASTGLLANLEKGWRDAFVATGVWDHDLYDDAVEHNPIQCFGSYLFINISLMRLFGVRVPGVSPEAVDQYFGDMAPYESEQHDVDESEEQAAGTWVAEDVLGAVDLAPFDADRMRIDEIRVSRPELTTLKNVQLAARITSFNGDLRRFFSHLILATLASGVSLDAVAQACAAAGRPDLRRTLTGGTGEVDGAAHGMWTLSRSLRNDPKLTALLDAGVAGFLDRLRASAEPSAKEFGVDFHSFIDAWDFRGQNEWELRAATWGTDPDLALTFIERLRHVNDAEAPDALNTRRAAEREEATTALRTALAGQEALVQFEAARRAGALWLRIRESQRTCAVMLLHELRLAALELGRRGVQSGHLSERPQIFMLFADELPAYLADQAEFVDVIRERERVYLELFDYEPPFVIHGQPAEYTRWDRRT